MHPIKIKHYESPFGEMIVGSYKEQLCLCDWRHRIARHTIDRRLSKKLNAKFVEEESEVVTKTIHQLEEYFVKERTEFDIPLLFTGSHFQHKVWDALREVPYGATESYLELSHRIGNPKAVRAVAAANGANSISIIVPCHRIIGSNNKLVGYAGGLHSKKLLLWIESPSLF